MKTRANTGFTLIEILIALTVLVVGLVGLLALFPVAAKSSNQSAEDSQASIIAKSVKNAIIDGVHAARIVQLPGFAMYEIPYSHSGVPLEGDGPGVPMAWEKEDPPLSGINSSRNIGRNYNGTYYIGLPVDPIAAYVLSNGALPPMIDGDLGEFNPEDPNDSPGTPLVNFAGPGYLLYHTVYYFPRRSLDANKIPLISPHRESGGTSQPPYTYTAATPVNTGLPVDRIDLNAAPATMLRVFYMGKWTAGTQEFKTPDRVLDLEGGLSDEHELDPYAQYCYRLEARPVIEKRPNPNSPPGVPIINVLVEGLWSFTIYVYRRYDLYLVKDAPGWYDFKQDPPEDRNKVVHKFSFQVAIR